MNIGAWIKRNNFTAAQYWIARGLLMSGPKATPPRQNAIRKTMKRLRRGDNVTGTGWRKAASI